MNFIRHVGKVGDRKVAIIFREVPNEPHMCLLVYTQILNASLHDKLIQAIESDIGQNSENLADALNRSYTQEGKIILQVLHAEGLLKKTQTSQVIMTPAPNVNIKLEELNKILDEMKQGESAVRRLAEIDSSSGLQDPADVARRLRGNSNPDVLDDTSLATQRMQQAEKMEREASGLLTEAKRLKEEALQMDPTLAPASSGRSKKESTNATPKTKKLKNVA